MIFLVNNYYFQQKIFTKTFLIFLSTYISLNKQIFRNQISRTTEYFNRKHSAPINIPFYPYIYIFINNLTNHIFLKSNSSTCVLILVLPFQ